MLQDLLSGINVVTGALRNCYGILWCQRRIQPLNIKLRIFPGIVSHWEPGLQGIETRNTTGLTQSLEVWSLNTQDSRDKSPNLPVFT